MIGGVADFPWGNEERRVFPIPPDRPWNDAAARPPPETPVESQAERLQRIAGNTVLARQVEPAESTASSRHSAAAGASRKTATQREQRADTVRTPAVARVLHPAEQGSIAAARLALAQVVASFESDSGGAELLRLAVLTEKAPSGIAEEAACAIIRAIMRAGPARRTGIGAQLRAQLADRRDLRLTRLLQARAGALLITPARRITPASPV